jgi:hypothetical protein
LPISAINETAEECKTVVLSLLSITANDKMRQGSKKKKLAETKFFQ